MRDSDITLLTESEIARLHHRLAVRSGTILLVTEFLAGAIAGWGLSLWSQRPVASLVIVLFALAQIAAITWGFHRTEGLMNRRSME